MYQQCLPMFREEEKKDMEAAKISVKERRGAVVVEALGRTGRGQSYIKAYKVLECPSIDHPDFKAQMDEAVKEMLGKEA